LKLKISLIFVADIKMKFPKQQKNIMLSVEEWDSVIEIIGSGDTVVCLGAELFTYEGKTLDELLGAELAGVGKNVHLYGDGLFHFKGTGHMVSYTKIKQYFNREHTHLTPILEQLAQIPVSVFINSVPDRQLPRTFDRLGLTYQYHYHHPNKPAVEPDEPSASVPYIYNLLGDVEHRESMVLTHEDLFKFMESLMEGKSVPRLLKERINACHNFLFIGLPFDKWHMKVLMHFLQKDANKGVLKFAANQALDTEVQSFVHDQFQIVCVPVQAAAFTDELHRRCVERGLIRKKEQGEGQTSVLDKWMRMVVEDSLGELLDELLDHFSMHIPADTESQNLLFGLSGRLSSLEKSVSRNIISVENAGIERSRIREAMLAFLNSTVKPVFIK
jgi:Effector-associated domain 11/SIR2-like domain